MAAKKLMPTGMKTSAKPIGRVVGQLDALCFSFETTDGKDWPKDLNVIE